MKDEIKTDGKYCDLKCPFLRAGVASWFCKKFEKILGRCLGGGVLRCGVCLGLENKQGAKT